MLARFSVKNWRDFEETELSLVATKERHFSNRLVKRGYTRLCPICAIVGKPKEISSYLMSLRLLQLVITRWDVFKQDFPLKRDDDKNISFEIDIFVDKILYHYKLECGKHGIINEQLKHRNYLVFDRSTSKYANEIRMQQTLLQYLSILGNKHTTNVYNWFKYEMKMLAPDQRLDFFDHWHPSFAARYTTDLMPVFHDLMSDLYPITYIVDGYENLLGRDTAHIMLNEYLSKCGKDTQTQLILTLDNMEMFNKRIFRLDERWILSNFSLKRI